MKPIERAEKSRLLLESEMFKLVMAELKADLVQALETSGFQDAAAHHELTISLQIVKRIHTKLQTWIEDGKIVEKRLKQDEWRAKQVEKAKKLFRV